MRVLFLQCAAILAVLSAPSSAGAEEAIEVRSLGADEKSPSATLADLNWLPGHWKGEGLGGASEEIIAPAAGGQMMGMFRQSEASGELKFYEFYLFAETENSLTLRIKHFTPALHGWEEKHDYVEFPLVSLGDDAVYFDGLTYKKTGPNTLSSAVNIEGRGVVEFQFVRQGAQSGAE